MIIINLGNYETSSSTTNMYIEIIFDAIRIHGTPYIRYGTHTRKKAWFIFVFIYGTATGQQSSSRE
jgi:hypothetical protein